MHRIANKLPVSKEVEPLLEIDRNPRKLEAFLSNKSSSSKSNMLTIADLKKFLPCTINLDPYLRKLIRGKTNYYYVNMRGDRVIRSKRSWCVFCVYITQKKIKKIDKILILYLNKIYLELI